MRKIIPILFSGVLLATTLVGLAPSPASAATTLITCTDLTTQKTVALKETQKSCKSMAAPALWQIQQPDSLVRSGAGYVNIRVCLSKNPHFTYRTIKDSCNKNQITTDYWRVISAPEIPIIKEIMALGHDAVVVTFEPLKSETKIDLAVAYYLVTNIKTGHVSKSAPNNFSEIYIYDLSPLTSYTFQIAAVSVDGTSAPSSITRVITTGAVPIVYVAPTTPPLAAPAFTLSSSSETRTVNTAATGFTILSTGGAIASFAVNATPAGMSFNISTGALTGTPTSIAAATAYTVTATNASGSATRTFTFTVTAAVYAVGDRGPGGGIVYYVSATPFTSAGSTCNTTCKYLEVAPAGWNNGAVVANDPLLLWSSNTSMFTRQDTVTTSTQGIAAMNAYEKFNWKIGQGFYNTSVMKVAGATSTAQAAVLAYAGSSTAGQWFIPSMNELNELCKYAMGQTTGVLTVACTNGGTLKTGTANDLGGFVGDGYWSSSELNADAVWIQYLASGSQNSATKFGTRYVRPVRAF